MDELRSAFGARLQENVRMADYTTAQVGGTVPGLISVHTIEELVDSATCLWRFSVPFILLGSGSNVMVSDKGLNKIVLHNRAHNLRIDTKSDSPAVSAESGTILGTVARQSALRGLSGLEWAAPVPGTVGGAVYGNAGAHDGNMQTSLKMAKILHKTKGIQEWPVEELNYQYRSSVLKRENLPVVVLSAEFNVLRTSRDEAWAKIDTFQKRRKETQPPGASMGSIFRNPPGDYAGRLIEASGLKGRRIGRAMISPKHANFIVNLGGAAAQDIWDLIKIVQDTVHEKFGIDLVPEIELLGEFN